MSMKLIRLYKNYIKNIKIIDKIIYYNYNYLDYDGNDISHIKIFEISNIINNILKLKNLSKEENETFNKQMAKILLFVYHKRTIDYQRVYNDIILGINEIKNEIQR
jgi:hypothetical protein